jgi:hypothetical protein
MHSTGGLRPPLLVARADAVADGRFSPTRAILFPRGLTPPALGAGTTTIHRKNDDFAVHERTFDKERRASARRGLVKPTLCGENRALLCDHATDVQERRASARRGSVKPTLRGENRALLCDHATDVQERRASARRGSADTFTQTRARLLGKPPTVCGPITVAIACSDTTGGLRPPLLVARADAVADGRFSPTRAILFPRGLTPPALGAGTTTIHRKNDDFAVHERTFDQERRASARRGSVKPTLRGENRALLCDHATDVQERRASARGGSQTHPQWQTHPQFFSEW